MLGCCVLQLNGLQLFQGSGLIDSAQYFLSWGVQIPPVIRHEISMERATDVSSVDFDSLVRSGPVSLHCRQEMFCWGSAGRRCIDARGVFGWDKYSCCTCVEMTHSGIMPEEDF